MTTVAAVVAAIALWVAWRRRHPAPFPPALTFLLDIPLPGLRPDPAQVARQLAVEPRMVVLEIGPGSGIFTRPLLDLEPTARLVCVDVQAAILHKLRRRFADRSPSVVCADATALPFRDQSVDRILLSSVLGEVPDRQRALGECARVLSDGGAVAVAETLIDPDYVARSTLVREAEGAGLVATDCSGGQLSYVQQLARRSPQRRR